MAVSLIVADATNLALAALIGPQWGVFYKGSPVILPASVFTQVVSGALSGIASVASLIGAPNILPVTASMVDFGFKRDWPVSNYPQEQGAFQSFNKVTLPYDVRIKLACQGTTSMRQAFLQAVFAIGGNQLPSTSGAGAIAAAAIGGSSSGSLPLFDVVTPELTFTSCTCVHIDYDRTAEKGATMIVADLWFQEISVSATADFQSTASPGNAGPASAGNVQATAFPPGGGLSSIGSFFDPSRVT